VNSIGSECTTLPVRGQCQKDPQNALKNSAIVTLALHQAPNEQGKVRHMLDEVSRAKRDPHQLFYQIGLDLGFVPEETVRDAFITQWLREHDDEVLPIVMHIRGALEAAKQPEQKQM
jgi:hypothetical protein